MLTMSTSSINSLTSLGSNFYGRQPMYVPDYTVRAVTDVQYLKIHRGHYIAARQATLVLRHSRQRTLSTQFDNADDAFTKEWTKLKLSAKLTGHDSSPSDVSPRSPSGGGGGGVGADDDGDDDRLSEHSETHGMLNGEEGSRARADSTPSHLIGV